MPDRDLENHLVAESLDETKLKDWKTNDQKNQENTRRATLQPQ